MSAMKGNPPMDPISKALERANTERHSVRSWVQPSPVPESARGPKQTGNPRRQRTLDPEFLAQHRLLGGADENSMIADKYRLLRTRVLQTMRAEGWRSLGVTSPGTQAGKTVTAINLAISIARDGNHQVVLVDADIRKPSIAYYMGIDSSCGLPEYLTGEVALEDSLIDIINWPNLTVLPGNGQELQGPTPDVLKSTRMHDLLRDIPAASKSMVMVVDLPPVLIGDDVIAVGANLDSLLLVIEEGSTTIEELKQAAEQLSNFNLLGSVLNKSSEKPKSFEGYYGASG
jgi:protein-tyrosine kinase